MDSSRDQTTIELMSSQISHFRKSSENTVESNREVYYNVPDVRYQIGEGLHNLILKKNGVETHVSHSYNAGFSFYPNQSEIRSGKYLHIDTNFENVSWGADSWYINPYARYFPPTAVSPYNIFVQLPAQELERISTLVQDGVL